MKVILLKDVARIGRRHEVKEVPTGHALNYLIPRKMAELANAGSLKRLAEHSKKAASDQAQSETVYKETLEKLTKDKSIMEVEASEKGSLFKGINAEDIANHLKATGLQFESSLIELVAPIKELGEHEIPVTVGDKSGSFTLILEAKQK